MGLLVALAFVLALGACFGDPSDSATPGDGSGQPASSPPSIRIDVVVLQEGLSIPWDIAFAPDGRMFVSERRGRIQVYASGEPDAELLQTVEVPDVRAIGESGVMGMTVDRDFDEHPFLYVCASRDADGSAEAQPWVNELLRYRVTDQGLELEGTVFESTIRANRQHNGCAVEMDEDRRIWMTTGDALTRARGLPQLDDNLNGKVLRVNRDGSVPEDNPTLFDASEPGLIYTLGHRNPQGLALPAGGGEPYTAEHGPTTDDEINRVVPGGNYGWPCYIGADVIPDEHGGHETLRIECGDPDDYLPAAWSSGDPTIATSGLVFLSGEQWGAWEGNLIAATLKQSDLRRFVLDDDGRPVMEEILMDEEFGRLRAVVIGPDGALYVSTSNGSNLSKEGQTPEPEVYSDLIFRITPRAADG